MPNNIPPPEESKMISFQLSPELYQRFINFCFKTEITRSDAIRWGLEILMASESFLATKGKEKNVKVQS